MRNNSVALGEMKRLGSVATLVQRPSFLGRVFGRNKEQGSVLPVFALPRSRSLEHVVVFDMQNPRARDLSSGLSTHAWAADKASATPASQTEGVRVFSEVHQECQELDCSAKEKKLDDDAWA